MVNNVQRDVPPIGFWAYDSVIGAHSRAKALVAKIADDEIKLSYWQFVFLQSRANGGFYDGENLPQVNWRWPKNTWFQHRLNQRTSNSSRR